MSENQLPLSNDPPPNPHLDQRDTHPQASVMMTAQKFCVVCGKKLRKNHLCSTCGKRLHLDDHLNIYLDSNWIGGRRFTLRQITEDGVYVYWGRWVVPKPGYFGDPADPGKPEALYEVSLGKRLALVAVQEGGAQ